MNDIAAQIARMLATRQGQTNVGPIVQALTGAPDPRQMATEQYLRGDGQDAWDMFQGMQNRALPQNVGDQPTPRMPMGQPDPQAMMREQYLRSDGSDAWDEFQGMQNSGGTMPPQYPWREGKLDNSSFDDAAAYQVAQADTGTMTDTAPFDGRALASGLDLNVAQAQRSGQALRLLQSESILRELEQQGGRVGQGMLEWLPDGLENMLVDEDYGKFQQARDAFAEAAMRADTGATINESEWPRILKNLMPRPGDGPERIAQRRAAREVFIQSLLMSSGEAAGAMPDIGQPVVPIQNANPTELSDEDLLRMLQGGN